MNFYPVCFFILIQPALYKVQFNGYHAAYCITVAQMLLFCNVARHIKREREEGNLYSLEMNMWSLLVLRKCEELVRAEAGTPLKGCCVEWSSSDQERVLYLLSLLYVLRDSLKNSELSGEPACLMFRLK